jgi:HAD superfamily hydrolase (TIGR01549 family)
LIEAIVFDLDGTLIHLPIDYGSLFQEFGRIMKTHEVRPLTKTIPRLDEKTRRKIFKAWDEAELEALACMTVNDKGMTLYKEFVDKPKALVTMQGRALVQKIIERLSLSFNSVTTREYSLNRVRQLNNAVRRLGAAPPHILLVGDTDDDLLAAQRAGCQFVRVRE